MGEKDLRKICLSFLSFIILVISTTSCSKTDTPHNFSVKTYLMMDTFVTIKIPNKNAGTIFRLCNKRMREFEEKFNYYSSKSELSRINFLKAGEKLLLSDDMFKLLLLSKEMSRKTDGLFDITAGPLIKLWSDRDRKTAPDEREIRDAMSKIGSDKWVLDKDDNTILLMQEGMDFDPGGIAKGFIVDETIEFLKNLGIRDALIEAGGDIYCLNTDNTSGWSIGIRHPDERDRIIGIIKLKNKAIATSGGYERFTEIGGKKFSHIVNPKTGYPEKILSKSVSVIADSCAVADALATGLMLMASELAIKKIDEIQDVEGIIIDENRNIYTSRGILLDRKNMIFYLKKNPLHLTPLDKE